MNEENYEDNKQDKHAYQFKIYKLFSIGQVLSQCAVIHTLRRRK